MSGIFRLNTNDLVKGLVVAILGGVATALSSGPVDWGNILRVSLICGISYLAKNLLTTENGNIVGIIPTTKS